MPLDQDHPPADWLLEPRDPRPWPLRRLSHRASRSAAVLAIGVMAVTIIVLIAGVRVDRQDSGHVGVVRNGGALDNRAIRQILMPGQRMSWIGLFSQSPHEYPAAKIALYYTITSDARRGDRREVDVVNVPTQDGVLVGLEGTVFFKFTGERDLDLLRKFDQTFGMRSFPVVGEDRTIRPWEGDEGFAAVLDATFRPILDNDLRTEVGRFACAELVASCTLVKRVVAPADVQRNANVNIASVEQRLSQSLRSDLIETLGGDYFRDIHVRISRVTLPDDVQGAVNDVHSKYVAVSGARADVRRAGYEAARNELLAKSYNKSDALSRIEQIKAAPKGSTIVLNGGSSKDKQPGINVGGG